MDWLQNMNNALQYIEDNICNDIKSDEVAKIAFSSKYHFIRMFNMVTGITLGEYIRQRRLSLAVKDVMAGTMKIIDIAYKYGYESPEAFTKAFKKLHGISPSQARRQGVSLKAIPPISFQIQIKGEKKMDYKIIKKEGFKIVGVNRRISTTNGDNYKDIPKFWEELCSNGTGAKLNECAGDMGIIGVCYNCCCDSETMDYMIAVEGEQIVSIDDYKVLDIPDTNWAIFTSIGPLPEAIQSVWKRIYSEWFPATKYEHAGTPELEVYLPGDPNGDDYKCEVWIPIIEIKKAK